MKYWTETADSHLKIWNTEKYPSHWRLRHEFNEQGYRCPPLRSSQVLYLGSCDVMTNLERGGDRWASLLHLNYYLDQPFVALGTVAVGLATMVRRLHAYIENWGAPRIVYMTIPRFDGHEFVTKSGHCINATRTGTARFAFKAGMVDAEELEVWLLQIQAHKAMMNLENLRYTLEERFSFLELMCRHHNIRLFWTFNPSDAGIVMLHRYIDAFKNISPFMKASFVGVPTVKDHQWDRSIGILTHREIYEAFRTLRPSAFASMHVQAAANYEWLCQQYGDELIKNDD